MKKGIAAEFFPHPDGLILAMPVGSINSEKLRRIIRDVFRKHNKCLLKAETIGGKIIIRPFDGFPSAKKPCLNMLYTLCKGLNIEDVELSGDLVAYDTSGRLWQAMTQPLDKSPAMV